MYFVYSNGLPSQYCHHYAEVKVELDRANATLRGQTAAAYTAAPNGQNNSLEYKRLKLAVEKCNLDEVKVLMF